MRKPKGLLIILIIIAVFFAITKVNENAQFNEKKEFIKTLNQTVADYNLDIIKKNTIIVKYEPNVSSDFLFKEMQRISMDSITKENADTMIELYRAQHEATMEYNDALLEYYRTILGEE